MILTLGCMQLNQTDRSRAEYILPLHYASQSLGPPIIPINSKVIDMEVISLCFSTPFFLCKCLTRFPPLSCQFLTPLVECKCCSPLFGVMPPSSITLNASLKWISGYNYHLHCSNYANKGQLIRCIKST